MVTDVEMVAAGITRRDTVCRIAEFEVIRLKVAPAPVIGLPVGFVGAAESKAALRESGLPAVSNVSEKGGSAVAALNAPLYTAHP